MVYRRRLPGTQLSHKVADTARQVPRHTVAACRAVPNARPAFDGAPLATKIPIQGALNRSRRPSAAGGRVLHTEEVVGDDETPPCSDSIDARLTINGVVKDQRVREHRGPVAREPTVTAAGTVLE